MNDQGTKKTKIVSERVYSDGKLETRWCQVTRWTESTDKAKPPFEVKGIQKTEGRIDQ